MGSLKILGKSFIHSKKVMNRLYSAKANLIGINTQLQQQSALVRPLAAPGFADIHRK